MASLTTADSLLVEGMCLTASYTGVAGSACFLMLGLMLGLRVKAEFDPFLSQSLLRNQLVTSLIIGFVHSYQKLGISSVNQ